MYFFAPRFITGAFFIASKKNAAILKYCKAKDWVEFTIEGKDIMKKLILGITCIIFLLLLIGCSSQSGSGNYPDNPYLGQTPPDLKPCVFASGLISTQTSMERDITISPDLREIYFSRQADIYQVKYSDNKWGIPKQANFCTEYTEIEPYITPDNKRLYFVSDRPYTTGDESRVLRIWYMDREKKRLEQSGDVFCHGGLLSHN